MRITSSFQNLRKTRSRNDLVRVFPSTRDDKKSDYLDLIVVFAFSFQCTRRSSSTRTPDIRHRRRIRGRIITAHSTGRTTTEGIRPIGVAGKEVPRGRPCGPSTPNENSPPRHSAARGSTDPRREKSVRKSITDRATITSRIPPPPPP